MLYNQFNFMVTAWHGSGRQAVTKSQGDFKMQYRGFSITFSPALFSVQATAKNGKGRIIKTAIGQTREEATKNLKNQIDSMLNETHTYPED